MRRMGPSGRAALARGRVDGAGAGRAAGGAGSHWAPGAHQRGARSIADRDCELLAGGPEPSKGRGIPGEGGGGRGGGSAGRGTAACFGLSPFAAFRPRPGERTLSAPPGTAARFGASRCGGGVASEAARTRDEAGRPAIGTVFRGTGAVWRGGSGL